MFVTMLADKHVSGRVRPEGALTSEPAAPGPGSSRSRFFQDLLFQESESDSLVVEPEDAEIPGR